MPVVNISVPRLNGRLGQEVSVEELSGHLEDLGCDVDGQGQITLGRCPACGLTVESTQADQAPSSCATCGYAGDEPFEIVSQVDCIKLDLLADRPDIFDPAGLARALRGLLGLESGLPEVHVSAGELAVSVDADLAEPSSYRPYIVCAEAELPPITVDDLRDLMKLQENLHWAIGRDRKLASIGVYDADTINGPVRYRSVGPEELTFVPLGSSESMTPADVLARHPKGVAYAELLAEHARYPLLVDADEQVLSLPPIINSEATRVKVGSTRLFIDVTGTERDPVVRALAVLTSSIAAMGGSIKTVAVSGGGAPEPTEQTPDLAARSLELDREACNRWLGLELDAEAFVARAERMRLGIAGGPDRFTLSYPAYRSDVRHPVDLYEDIAIGHGYRHFDPVLVPTVTSAIERPEEVISGLARAAMLGLGYDEVMTMFQTTAELHYTRMRREPEVPAVRTANPKNASYDLLRTDLLPGLLETLETNRRKPAPQRLFEVDNVIAHAPEGGHPETLTRETRRLAFATLGPDAGYAEARAALDALALELGLELTYAPTEHPSFIPGRAAQVTISGGGSGLIGELHPEVLTNWHLLYPVACAELDLA